MATTSVVLIVRGTNTLTDGSTKIDSWEKAPKQVERDFFDEKAQQRMTLVLSHCAGKRPSVGHCSPESTPGIAQSDTCLKNKQAKQNNKFTKKLFQ